MPELTYEITLNIDRSEGQIASNDSIRERVQEALENVGDNIDLSGLGPQEISEYEVTDIVVEEIIRARK